MNIKRNYKTIITSILFFAIIDILLPFFLVWILNISNSKNQYEINSADILIMGDSHASFALDPEVFKENGFSVISYAKGGHYSEFNYYLYNKIKKN